RGDVATADEMATQALASGTEGGWAVSIGYAARALARAALAAGKLDEAESAIREAVRTFAECEARAQVARSRLVLAEVLAARHDATAAAAELGAAREAFTQMRVPR